MILAPCNTNLLDALTGRGLGLDEPVAKLRQDLRERTEATIREQLSKKVGFVPYVNAVAENSLLVDVTSGTTDLSRVVFFWKGEALFTRRVFYEAGMVKVEFLCAN